MTIYDMRCSYLPEPLGTDCGNLDFTWKVSDPIQGFAAGRIWISSTMADCIEGTGDVWEKRLEDRAEYHHIKYDGAALLPHRRYYWNAECSVGGNRQTGKPQTFLTGIAPADWKGEWILPADDRGTDLKRDQFLYRKSIFREESMDPAVYMYVASFGYHELYINGQKADDRVLTPGRSRIRSYRRVNAVAYDISAHLKQGENVLQIVTDAGWTRIEKNVLPALKVQLYDEAGQYEIHSDPEWELYQTGNRMNDRYKTGGFTNDEGWAEFGNEDIYNLQPAGKYDRSAELTIKVPPIHPGIVFEMIEADKVVEELTPAASADKNGIRQYDLGKNYTGYFAFTVETEQSKEIGVEISDKSSEQCSFNQKTTYHLQPGRSELCGRFQYDSGRYISITGLCKADQVQNARGLMISNDLERTGFFECSDPVLNKIFETDLYTFRANTVNGVTTDCPHRERLGYGEGALNTLVGCGLPFYEIRAFYKNYFHFWVDSQREDGYFPHVAPDYEGGGGTAWSSFPVTGFYEYYQVFHDDELLNFMYEPLKKWTGFLEQQTTPDGLLKRYENGNWNFLGDWAAPERSDWGQSEDALYFNTVYFAVVLDRMRFLAKVKGERADAERWDRKHRELARIITGKYYNRDEHFYYIADAKYQALAVWADIVPEQNRDSVYDKMLAIVQNKGYLDGGSFGTTILLLVLSRSARGNELIFQWLHREQAPSYRYFLNRGETAWPEFWDMRDIYGGSKIHTCYTGIAGWYLYGLMGMKFFRSNDQYCLKLTPIYPEGLDRAAISLDTPLGKVRFSWKRKDGQIIKNLDVPDTIRVLQ